jgi:hypothetical protein
VRDQADKQHIERFLDALGRTLRRPLRLYLVGGSAIVELGLRAATLDIDITAEADDPAALEDLDRVLPDLKNRLQTNVEWADPTGFLPIPRAPALERSKWQRAHGPVQVYHFDYAATALGKIGRGTDKDFADVLLLVRHAVVTWPEIVRLWQEVRGRPFGRAKQSVAEVETHMQLAAQMVMADDVPPESDRPLQT